MVKFSLGGFKQENAMIFEQKHMEFGSVGPTKQKVFSLIKWKTHVNIYIYI